MISLPTQEEFEKVRGSLAALVKRAAMVGNKIDYFPNQADRRYRLRLFVDPTALRPQVAEDSFELSGSYAYLGRIYFEVPGSSVRRREVEVPRMSPPRRSVGSPSRV